MFCNRVIAKVASKTLFWKGRKSASARITATFGSCFTWFFAFFKIFNEMSNPTISLAVCSICLKSSPVPQPASSMMLSLLRLVLFNATFIFAFCSSAY